MAKVLCVQAIHQVGMEILRKGSDVQVASNPSDETVIREGQEAEVLVVRITKVGAGLINALPKLRAIGRNGVGVDNVDVDAATRKGVAVINVPGANSRSVAEHVLAVLLTLAKRLFTCDQYIRDGRYTERDKLRGRELYETTLGVVGLGQIGRLVATMASNGLGMKVIAYDPIVAPAAFPAGVERKASLPELLSEADAVTVHVPLMAQTRDLFNKTTFAQMKPGSVFINAARGGIANEPDLRDALVSGHLSGAAVDVFCSEPPPMDNPLLSAPNVILTPHMAGVTTEAVIRTAITLANDCVRAANGEKPRNCVNPEAWSKAAKTSS
jgi:D-3-phosphoglycerate dehydrogenase